MDAVQNMTELKAMLKAAMVEVLQERGDLISDAVEEALEDIHLARAMDAAQNAGLADREQVAKLLGVTL